MEAIADAMSRFAQPLIDATDGSPEQLQRALTLSQLCWNLAITPEEKREEFLANMQPALKMDDEELQELKRTVVAPMIRRHQEMFPAMQRPRVTGPSRPVLGHAIPPPAPRRPVKKYAGTGRNERCPCGSGKSTRFAAGDEAITHEVSQLRAVRDTSLRVCIWETLLLGTTGWAPAMGRYVKLYIATPM